METLKTILIAALAAALVNTAYIPEITTLMRVVGNLTVFFLVYALVSEIQEKANKRRKAR